MNTKKTKGTNTYVKSEPSGVVPTSVPSYRAELGTRIEIAADALGDKRALAKACGVHETQMYRYIRGENEPTASVLTKISRATGVLLEWLATGEGPMRRGEVAVAAAEGVMGAQEPGADYMYLPLYDVQAAAGHGAVVEHEEVVDFLAFKKAWIRRELGADPNDLYLISVEGDSMEPALRPGDVILVDRRQAWTVPKDGVYVLHMDGSLLVKRLQSMPGGKIRVTSDNPAYTPFDLDRRWVDEHQNDANGSGVIGRVVWSGRRM